VVLLGPSTGIKEGSTAKEHNVLSLKVGEQMVGRVVNTLGFPIDGKDQLVGFIRDAFRKKSSWLSSVNQLLSHYKQVLAVDAMIPVGRTT
jgi:F-type H+-transporting ATPase subunit alpha